MYQLGFIGAGKLAGSVIRGLIRAKFYSPSEIIELTAATPNMMPRRVKTLRDRFRQRLGKLAARMAGGWRV